ncbi:hypothetical protein HCU01_42960 [Halomonas cupida]|uniref:Uncharacterized protein n=1 Tax=Halomonas cupida TaxID=44933 RepID=A0ABQ0WNG8_9GAMM|nr:hypothetical protein HCU01_42960 [Halomonas cupida]
MKQESLSAYTPIVDNAASGKQGKLHSKKGGMADEEICYFRLD